jgi:hypothetical protein
MLDLKVFIANRVFWVQRDSYVSDEHLASILRVEDKRPAQGVGKLCWFLAWHTLQP